MAHLTVSLYEEADRDVVAHVGAYGATGEKGNPGGLPGIYKYNIDNRNGGTMLRLPAQ
jgi:hypothetical protein